MPYLKKGLSKHSLQSLSLIIIAIFSISFMIACENSTMGIEGKQPSSKKLTSSPSPMVGSSLSGTETQITSNRAAQQSPAIDGNYIVWQDERNIQPNIYLYNIPNQTKTRITDYSSFTPKIDGNRIVYMGGPDLFRDIFMYDISSKTETQITDDTYEQHLPDISGNYIVWEEWQGRNYDIFMYDISNEEKTQLTDDYYEQSFPHISGNYIVWEDERNGNADIYMYDISTETETQITTNSAYQLNPAIDGDHIVWRDNRNGNWDIYMYDISTETETQITTNSANQHFPAIHGDRIVWEDRRNSSPPARQDILFLYDIATGNKSQITSVGSLIYSPDIYGDRIVWYDRRNGNPDIYLYEIQGGDTTPPEITFDVVETSLWPPNHKMKLVVEGITATDNVDPNPQLTVTVTSNEFVNDIGDGNTDTDWEVKKETDGSYTVYVRAERNGESADRIYTIDIVATDDADNTKTKSVVVTIPHNRS